MFGLDVVTVDIPLPGLPNPSGRHFFSPSTGDLACRVLVDQAGKLWLRSFAIETSAPAALGQCVDLSAYYTVPRFLAPTWYRRQYEDTIDTRFHGILTLSAYERKDRLHGESEWIEYDLCFSQGQVERAVSVFCTPGTLPGDVVRQPQESLLYRKLRDTFLARLNTSPIDLGDSGGTF